MTSPTRDSDAATADIDAVRARFLAALLKPDTRDAWATIEAARAGGLTPAGIYLTILTPAMQEVGALWERAQIGVAQEHLATQIVQTILARLAPDLADGPDLPARAGVAVVSGTPGELHAIGARMVADFLEGAGWDVLMLGPDTPGEEIVATAVEHRPQVVALSTSLSSNLLAAARVFTALRRLEPTPLLVGGGRAYDGQMQRALVTGADVFAADPESLVAELRARLA